MAYTTTESLGQELCGVPLNVVVATCINLLTIGDLAIILDQDGLLSEFDSKSSPPQFQLSGYRLPWTCQDRSRIYVYQRLMLGTIYSSCL